MDYPYDIVTYIKKKGAKRTTLSVEGHFIYDGEESPMKVFHKSFSRFKFAIIDSGEGATWFNIHMKDLPGIEKRTEAAALEYFKPKQVSGDIPDTPAFKVRFTNGNIKGKTPAEVLAEADSIEEGGKILNGQYKWLMSNLEKYPKNKVQMDAISEAAKLKPEDLALLKAIVPYRPLQILSISSRPLMQKQKDNGMYPCYEGYIVWDMAKDYPVTVTARNYDAPVKKNEDGTLNVMISGKDKNSESVRSFNLTADEWLNAVSDMKYSKEAFRICNFNKAWNAAETAGKAWNKAENSNKQGESTLRAVS